MVMLKTGTSVVKIVLELMVNAMVLGFASIRILELLFVPTSHSV
uniref:Ion_trans domain-containing protein n=1 Tax=Heterorhabditis bacteriophora TaxID=37862 RepID=A0A1I7W6J5_HETBA